MRWINVTRWCVLADSILYTDGGPSRRPIGQASGYRVRMVRWQDHDEAIIIERELDWPEQIGAA